MRSHGISTIVLVAVVLAFAGCAAHKAAPAVATPADATAASAPKTPPPAPPARPAATPPPVTGTGSVNAPSPQTATPPAAPAPTGASGKDSGSQAPPATASAYVFSPQQAVSASPTAVPSPSPHGTPALPATNPRTAEPGKQEPAPSQPPGVLQLVVAASAGEVGLGDVVIVDVIASSESSVVDAPLHLSFDPGVLEFVDGLPGDFLTQGGSSIVFLADGLNRPGDVAIAAGRVAREQGASGSGLLCRIRLRGAAVGATPVTVGQAKAWGAGGVELTVQSAGTRVVVR